MPTRCRRTPNPFEASGVNSGDARSKKPTSLDEYPRRKVGAGVLFLAAQQNNLASFIA